MVLLQKVAAFYLIFLVSTFFSACNSKPASPFPEPVNGHPKPLAKPLHLSDPVPVQWKQVPSANHPKIQMQHLDLDRLPQKPLVVNDFRPFKKSPASFPLNLNGIPDSLVGFNKNPGSPWTFRQSVLPAPTRSKIGIPKIYTGAGAGIMQLSADDGIPGLKAGISMVDKEGFTWFSTERGISRYEGEELMTYACFNGLNGSDGFRISGMVTDQQGRIWVTVFRDGIYVFDLKNNLLWYNNNGESLTEIICDHSGAIWTLNPRKGLSRIDPVKRSRQFLDFPGADNLSNYPISICEDGEFNLWIGTSIGIFILDPDHKGFKELSYPAQVNNTLTVELKADKRGDVWAGTMGGGMMRISRRQNSLTIFDPSMGLPSTVLNIDFDSKGRIWLLWNDSLAIIDLANNQYRTLETRGKLVVEFKSSSLIDLHGILWILTQDRGILMVDTKGALPDFLTESNGLVDKNVWSLYEDRKGLIWMGSYKGLQVYDPEKNRARLLSLTSSGQFKGTSFIDQDIDGNYLLGWNDGFSLFKPERKTMTNFLFPESDEVYIKAGIPDSSNNLFLVTSRKFERYDLIKNSLAEMVLTGELEKEHFSGATRDNLGKIWLIYGNGIAIIDPRKNTRQLLTEKEGLCYNQTQAVHLVDGTEIWIGTSMGISIVDLQKNKITNITRADGLFNDNIYSITDDSSSVYIGTTKGMYQLNKRNNHFQLYHFGNREGYPYNDYNQMAAITTRKGQTWWGVTPMVTINTLVPQNDTSRPIAFISRFKVLDESPGFRRFSNFKNILFSRDTLWTENGDKFYLPENLPEDSMYAGREPIKIDSVAGPYNLPVGMQLPYDHNSISFSFANSIVNGRDKIYFRYILEGIDTSWSPRTELTYSRVYYNLAPGSYSFLVATTGSNGRWSEPAIFSFVINPPWWQTWWAILLDLLLFGITVWAIVQFRSRWLKEENRILEMNVQQRTSQLNKSIEDLKGTQAQLIQSEKMASLGELTAGIAHEIQNPLNFINNFSEVNAELIAEMKSELALGNLVIANEIADNIEENERKINQHGKRADGIVKGMLQHSRRSNGIKEPTNLNTLADEYFRLAYHGLRAKDKAFNATMKTEFDNSLATLNVVPQDIGRVVLNLITNAFYAVGEKIKTAANGYEPTVTVSTKNLKDHIEIRVKDNGNGIPPKLLEKIFHPFFTTKPTGQGTGLGLSLSYDIVKAHNGELKVETKPGEGSTFIIKLPLT